MGGATAGDNVVQERDDVKSLSHAIEDFANLLQEYQQQHALFVSLIKELHSQLTDLHTTAPNSMEPIRSDVLDRAYEKAPSPQFRAYLDGNFTTWPKDRQLAEALDFNLQALPILRRDMALLLTKLNRSQQVLFTAVRDGQQGSDQGLCLTEAGIVAAAVCDSLAKDLELVGKVTKGVSLATPVVELSSYATLLEIQPDVQGVLIDEVMSWRVEGKEAAGGGGT